MARQQRNRERSQADARSRDLPLDALDQRVSEIGQPSPGEEVPVPGSTPTLPHNRPRPKDPHREFVSNLAFSLFRGEQSEAFAAAGYWRGDSGLDAQFILSGFKTGGVSPNYRSFESACAHMTSTRRRHQARIGVLLHYRRPHQDLFDFTGKRIHSSIAAGILGYEQIRILRPLPKRDPIWQFRLPELSLTDPVFRGLSESDFTIHALAPRDVLDSVSVLSRQDIFGENAIVSVGLNELPRLRAKLASSLEAGGGELVEIWTLVPKTWDTKWVTPEHHPNPIGKSGPTTSGEPSSDVDLAGNLPAALSDLMSIRSAAESLGRNHAPLVRAIANGEIPVYELGDGTKVVSLRACQEWAKNRNPVGRPRKST